MPAQRSRTSAGILLYRLGADDRSARRAPYLDLHGLELLLGHMGGPFWRHKDAGAWTIPKGEYEADEDPLGAARREFSEEIGQPVPATSFHPLGSVRQSGGKIVHAWAAEGDLDPATTVSSTFEIEWPPHSGLVRAYPELDRTAWVAPDRARGLLVRAQTAFLDRLLTTLGG